MIRFMLKNNNIEVFDFYDKHLIFDISKNDISKNDIFKNDTSLYESDSDYSEMYTSSDGFECIDISNIDQESNQENIIVNEKNKISSMKKKMEINNETKQNVEEIEINNETGILRQSFYNLGKRLFNYTPI